MQNVRKIALPKLQLRAILISLPLLIAADEIQPKDHKSWRTSFDQNGKHCGLANEFEMQTETTEICCEDWLLTS
jgi:hypothetical protein